MTWNRFAIGFSACAMLDDALQGRYLWAITWLLWGLAVAAVYSRLDATNPPRVV